MSFSEVEARVYKEIAEHTQGEFFVHSIAKKDYEDIFKYEDSDVWYHAVIIYLVTDADTDREKLVKHRYLVSAHNVLEANGRMIESLKGLMSDYEILEVKKTDIIEIFPYQPMSNLEFTVPEYIKRTRRPTKVLDIWGHDLFYIGKMVLEKNGASASLLAKELKISHPKASDMINKMQDLGIVGPFNGTKPRVILVNSTQLTDIFTKELMAEHEEE